MLKARIPNLEMHIYGNGVHGNGLKDRDGTPFGTWQYRFIDWFRDLGFLGKPGVETKAAKDVRFMSAAPAPTPPALAESVDEPASHASGRAALYNGLWLTLKRAVAASHLRLPTPD